MKTKGHMRPQPINYPKNHKKNANKKAQTQNPQTRKNEWVK